MSSAGPRVADRCTLDDMARCPNCDEPGCDSECLLIGTGLPGADRRAYLREDRQARQR
jgi:hypothetical protein